MNAQEITQVLVARGYTPQEISELLGGRFSARTVYRWLKGETDPQRATDLDDLRGLYDRLETKPGVVATDSASVDEPPAPAAAE